ncbi:MAG: hypothetical protein IJ060_02215 [Oscillospiraceae bacterium]|nr:hypothetical protein [Oscillospiraceae bacterium]
MNHRRLRLFAALGALLLLGGCGTKKNPDGGGDLHLSELELQELGARETDLSKRFPEYFQYCFGEDASFRLLHRAEDDGYGSMDVYELTYRDKTGALCTTEYSIEPYSAEYTEAYGNSEIYYRQEMQSLAEVKLREIFNRGFSGEILVKHLGGSPEDWTDDPTKATIWMVESFLVSDSLEESGTAAKLIADGDIEPGTGWQVCTADWKSVASNEEWLCRFDLYIPFDADANAYEEKMIQIRNDYLSCNDQPKSFLFQLIQQNEGDTAPYQGTTVWKSACVLGEETAFDRPVQVSQILREKLIGKYQ